MKRSADSALFPTRPVRLAPRAARAAHRADGSILITSPVAPAPHAETWIHKLEDWAARAPDRILLTEADGAGGRRNLTFGEALASASSLA